MNAEYHRNEIMPSQLVHWDGMIYTPEDLTVTLVLFCSALSFNDRSVACAFFELLRASFNDSLLCSLCYSDDNGAAAHRGT